MYAWMQNPEVCETSDDCYAAVQRHRFVWAEPGDVTALAVGNPGQFTAAIIFEMPHSETAPVDSFKLHVRFHVVSETKKWYSMQ